jgi:lipopolysaccharide transport system permease protein
MEKHSSEEKWTLVVKPKSGWFDLNLKDVWRYRDLIAMFVKRDFTSVYKQTILGPLWFFIQPLLTTILFIVIFSEIAKIPTSGIPSSLFYLSGITIWNYFATCFTKTSTTFLSNSGIFGKVYFPRLTAPLSMIIGTMINFVFQFFLLMLFIAYFIIFKGLTLNFTFYLLLIPFLLLVVALLSLGAGIIMSSLTTKYRDLSYLLGFGVQLLMYLTPVAYPLSVVMSNDKFPKMAKTVILANPMTAIVESFRYAFFPVGNFNWSNLAYSCAISLIILLIGIMLFSRTEKNFIDTV